MNILEVKDLSISFEQYSSGLRKRTLKVAKHMNLDVREGEVLAVFGASGSGKSLLAHAILGLLPVNAVVNGEVRYRGQVLDEALLDKLRGEEIAFIPQTINSLNPLQRSGIQVELAIKDKKTAQRRRRELFQKFELTEDVARLYPFELSGGMARKVLVSAAIMKDCSLIIADEPSPGMDNVAVDELVDFFRGIPERGASAIVITHDIMMALRIADRIAVFYDGSILEVADVKCFTGRAEGLKHPYSRALWNALPQNGFEVPNYGELKAVGEVAE